MPQYTLGKDATIVGVPNTSVRNVTATVEGSQIDQTKRGDTSRKYKSGWKEATIEIEMLDNPPAGGSELTITHANSGLSGTFIVTNVAESQPLDDVVTYQITCKMKTAPGGGA